MGDMNWRDKDDFDLTAEDIDAMAAEGTLVDVRGPRPVMGARFFKATSWGSPQQRDRVSPVLAPIRTAQPVGTHFV